MRENLDELQQTVTLLQAESSDEFYDVSTRNKKYGRVDTVNGPALLEKYVAYTSLLVIYVSAVVQHLLLIRLSHMTQNSTKTDKFTALSSRFGMKS